MHIFISHAVAGEAARQVGCFSADLLREVNRRLMPGSLAEHWGAGAEPFAEEPGTPASSAFPAPPVFTPAMSCRAMVALYSPEYVTSARCRYERQVFQERMAWEAHRTGRPSSAMVSVVWNPAGLPPGAGEGVAASSGMTSFQAGGDYPRRGVVQLLRDPAARGGYATLVRQVAERLADGALHPPPPMTSRDVRYFMNSVQNPSEVVRSSLSPLPSASARWQNVNALAAGLPPGSRETEGSAPWEAPSPLPDRPATPTRSRSWFSLPEAAARPILRGPHM